MEVHAANTLIVDHRVYPRDGVDGDHVFNLMEALRSGAKLPPPVICKTSLRIVDGVHRVTAWQRIASPDVEIECVAKSYANDAELFLDAVKYNSAHGRHLSRDDRARIAQLGDQLKVDETRLAAALLISVACLGGLRASNMIHNAELRSKATVPATTRAFAKRPLCMLDGGRNKTRNTYTLSGHADEYAAEVARLQRAKEIVDRINWDDAPGNLLEALIELRESCLAALPMEVET